MSTLSKPPVAFSNERDGDNPRSPSLSAVDPAPSLQNSGSHSSYANSVIFSGALPSQCHPVQVPDSTPVQPTLNNLANSNCLPEAGFPNLSAPLPPPNHMEELIALCLLAKPWGEILPISLIIAKTKNDWKHVKGSVEYIDLGNGWILLKFSSVADKDYVWTNRPWFVKGLNLVLNSWVPFFDPYSATIGCID